MKEKDDILNKGIESLKSQQIPKGPSNNLTESTLEKLNQAANKLPQETFNRQVVSTTRFIINNLVKIAAVVILSIAIGYSVGRISASNNHDMEQIRAELEPQMREEIFEEVTQYVQLELTNNYVEMKQEFTKQYFKDLRQVAVEIINASGAITNNLLDERIQTIAAMQLQDRQRITAAIQQTEQNVAVIARYITTADFKNNYELENSNN